MAANFMLDAAQALLGPDWLAARRAAAAERLRDVAWPTASEESGDTAASEELNLDVVPVPAELLGDPGVEDARWRSLAAGGG